MPTTTPFNNLITFSRGSNATVTGSNGLIQWAPNNLLTFSEQFDNAAWTKGAGATVVANNQVAPDGTTTADTITFTAGGATEFVRAFATFTVGLVYTVSVYARRISGTPTFIFDVGNGAAISGAQPITSEWQRFSFTFTFSGANQWVDLEASAAGSISFWGAQLELGSTATTYNPTTVKNLLGFSEAFDNAAWTKVRTSVVTGAAANPINGLFNAQKLMEDTTASSSHFASQTVSGHISGTTYTFSIYAKAAGRTQLRMNGDTAFGLSNPAIFNLDTGTVASNGAFTASIQSIGNGWYRCVCTGTPTAAGSGVWVVGLAVSGATSYTGDGNSGVYIYGAQLSDSASLDPYVPTPGAAPSSTAFYGPRFDFDPVTLLPRGLLVEEQRTNLALRSAEFDNASWSKTNITVTANADVSPDGMTNADTLLGTAPGSANTCTQSITAAASVYTFSVWVKAGTAATAAFLFRDATAAANLAATGQILSGPGSVSGTTAITVSGLSTTQWTRVAVTLNAAATAGNTLILLMFPETSTSANTTGKSNVFWGAQLETGAFATSYIPTVASTVTRSADVATITGQNFAQWFNPDQGAIVFEGVAARREDLPVLAGYRTPGTASFLFLNGANAGSWNGSAAVAQVGGNITNGTLFKAAMAYSPAGRAVTSNGGAIGTDSNTIGAAALLSLGMPGSGPAGGQILNGHIRNIRFIPARAADFQLQALST